MVKSLKLADLKPDLKNVNTGTPRGGEMLRRSLQNYGAARSIVVDKNLRVIAGNQTLEAAAAVGLDAEIILVPSDGKKLCVVQRVDVDIDSKAGRELAIADNRTNEVSFQADPLMLAWHASNGVDVNQFWMPAELEALELPEIDVLDLAEEEQQTDAGLDDCDDVQVEVGQIWLLGNNELHIKDDLNVKAINAILKSWEKATGASPSKVTG